MSRANASHGIQHCNLVAAPAPGLLTGTDVESARGLFLRNGLSGFSVCDEEVMESDNSVNLITHRSDVDVWDRRARRSWTIDEWLGQWAVPIAGASLLAYGTYSATRGSRRGVW